MMGYLDRTWCPQEISNRCSHSQGCYRVFTEEDRKAAEKWWGNSDFPISQFAEEPGCFIPLSKHKTDGS